MVEQWQVTRYRQEEHTLALFEGSLKSSLGV